MTTASEVTDWGPLIARMPADKLTAAASRFDRLRPLVIRGWRRIVDAKFTVRVLLLAGLRALPGLDLAAEPVRGFWRRGLCADVVACRSRLSPACRPDSPNAPSAQHDGATRHQGGRRREALGSPEPARRR